MTGVGITQNYHLSIRLNTLYDWKMVVATFFGILVNSGILVIAMLASGLNSVVYQFFFRILMNSVIPFSVTILAGHYVRMCA